MLNFNIVYVTLNFFYRKHGDSIKAILKGMDKTKGGGKKC
jgi:hypothetical protein